MTCPHIESVFEILGRKWNGRLIHHLAQQPAGASRFTDIQRDLGDISPRALSLKLSELAGHGIVTRVPAHGSGAAPGYTLSERGLRLARAMRPLRDWAREDAVNQSAGEAAVNAG